MCTFTRRLFVVFAVLNMMSCTTVSMKAVGRVEVQRGVERAEEGQITAYTDESVSGVATLCALTFFIYGGGCWAYLAYPTDASRREFEKKITDLVERSASCLKVRFIRAERHGWAKMGDRLEVMNEKGKVFLTESLQQICRQGPPLVSTPTSSLPKSNDAYEADASVLCDDDGCRSFRLKVTNKTDQPIAIDWNRTQFIQGAQTRGNFMFEGVSFVDRNIPLSPAIVLPHSTYQQTLFPSILVEDPSRESGWHHLPFSPGDVGIALTIDLSEKQAFEAILFRLELPGQADHSVE